MLELEKPISKEKEVEYIYGLPKAVYNRAVEFGFLHDGWTLQDYILYAVDPKTLGGYETILIHGPQGSGKSSFALWIGYWVYGDWDKVLRNIVFKPQEFVKKMKSIPKGEYLPLLIWDDVGVHYPSTTFRTDIQEYQAIDAVWTAIRTKCKVIVCTIPLIDRLAKNIKDNVTFEVFIGKNQRYIVERLFRLPGIERIDTNFFKAVIEGLEKPVHFQMEKCVPTSIFRKYWEKRLQLTEEALEKLERTVEPISPEGYIDLLDAVEMAKDKGIRISPHTLLQLAFKGVLKKTKIGDTIYLEKERFEKWLRVKTKQRRKSKT